MRRLFLVVSLMFVLPAIGLNGLSSGVRSGVGANTGGNQGVVKGISVRNAGLGREVISREARNNSSVVDEYFGPVEPMTRSQMIEKVGMVIFPEDHVEFFPEPTLGLGSRITVMRAKGLELNDGGKVEIIRTWANTVGELLKEKEMELNPGDVLSMPKNQLISRGMKLTIKRSQTAKEIERFYLPYKVIVEEDPMLVNGKVRIKQQGEMGQRQIIWFVTRRNNNEVKRELAGYEIIKPVDKVVIKGIKPVHFKGPYYDWIVEAGERYGADPDVMYRIMMCESGGDPYALSPSQKYHGLYQYDNLTWSASGFGDKSIFDPWSQINAAAKAWDSRYTKWPVTSKVCGDVGE